MERQRHWELNSSIDVCEYPHPDYYVVREPVVGSEEITGVVEMTRQEWNRRKHGRTFQLERLLPQFRAVAVIIGLPSIIAILCQCTVEIDFKIDGPLIILHDPKTEVLINGG